MTEYLSHAELKALTGRPQHKRQIDWLRRYKWRFMLDDQGRPKVERAYWHLRLVGPRKALPNQPLNQSPVRRRKTIEESLLANFDQYRREIQDIQAAAKLYTIGDGIDGAVLYFLLSEDREVVYVGLSRYHSQRMWRHFLEKPFTYWCGFNFPDEILEFVEEYHIALFTPRLNCHPCSVGRQPGLFAELGALDRVRLGYSPC